MVKGTISKKNKKERNNNRGKEKLVKKINTSLDIP